MNQPNDQILLRALSLNSLFSGMSGVCMFLAGDWIAAQLGLPATLPVYVTGCFLLIFSLQLANIVRTRVIRTWEIMALIGGDLAWVAASIVLVAMFFESLTTAGLLLVDLVAVVVLVFAIQQFRGVKALGR